MAIGILFHAAIGDGGCCLEIAVANNDRDGHTIDRCQRDRKASVRHRLIGHRAGFRDRPEKQVHPILPVGQAFGGANAQPDGLWLVGRQGDTPRRVADHGLGRLLHGIGLFLANLFQPTIGGHPAEFERNPVGGGFRSDIVQNHFGAAVTIEHDPCRCNEKIACGLCRRACHHHGCRKAGQPYATGLQSPESLVGHHILRLYWSYCTDRRFFFAPVPTSSYEQGGLPKR